MNERLQPGFLDRVFNSTLSLPQQMMWRVWRALEDDKIDLFSEKGILDGALVPIFGIADSHQHDVMPDYMAEQLGFADKGKSGFWSQLGAAIVSDPLSWMSSGLTSLAKVGSSASKAASLPAFTARARAAAAAKNVPLDEFVGNLSPAEFRKLLVETAGDASQVGRAARKGRRTANKLLSRFDKSIVDAGRVATAKGMGAQFTIGQAIRSTRDRQIALGLPILSMFGAQKNIAEGYSSWWKLFKDGVSRGGTAVTESMLWKGFASVPGMTTALNTIAKPYRHGMFGYRHGQDAQIMLPNTERAIKGESAAQYVNYLSADGGRDIGTALERAFSKNKDLMTNVKDKFDELLKSNATYEDAFVGAMKANGIVPKGSTESAASIWGRLSGLTKDNDVFPKWANKSVAAGQIENTIKRFRASQLRASTLFHNGEVTLVAAETESRKLAQALAKEREGMPDVLRIISQSAFDTGTAFRGVLNKIFKSGEKVDFGSKQYAKFLSNVARDNDQVEVLASELYKEIGRVAKDQNVFTYEELNRVVANVTQLDALPGELAATFRALDLNQSDPTKILAPLQAFLNRHHASIITFEKILKTKGVTTGPARDKLVKFFDDDVFPFVERTTPQGDRTFEVSFGADSPAVEFAEEILFTPAEKLRMKRVANAHVVRGDDILPDLVGKQAGTLTNAQLDDAVSKLTRKATRVITQDEVMGALSGGAPEAALKAFQKQHGVTMDETLGLLRRTGTAATRRLARRVDVEKPVKLWDKGRTQWTAEQAEATLSNVGMALRSADDGKLHVDFMGWARANLSAEAKEAAKRLSAKKYGTYAGAMRAAHNFMSKNKQAFKDVSQSGFASGLEIVSKPIVIKGSAIEKLRRELVANGVADDVIRGTAQIEDTSLLSANAAADFSRLRMLKERRALPAKHALHEPGAIVGKKVRVATGVRKPRAPQEVRSLLTKGDSITSTPVSKWAKEYASARALVKEMDDYVARATQHGVPIKFDPQLLVRLERHLGASGGLIREAVEDALPEGMRRIFDKTRALSAQSFQAARRSGVWVPGSPIAYLPRFFNKSGRARVEKLIGEIDVEDGHILMRLGVKQSQYFKRSFDEMTLEDLDNLQAELRQAMNEGTASPRLAELQKQLDKELADAGVQITGVPKNLPYDKARRLEHDPFVSLLQRLGVAQQNDTLAGYFDTLLESSKSSTGESLLMAGKVIGVIDDAGRTHKTTRQVSKTTTEVKEGGEAVAKIAQGEKEFGYVPKSLLIEASDGSVRVIENGMFSETGFGLLPLARDVSEQAGQKISYGHSFARASLRSDLHQQMINKAMVGETAAELIGQHVVFGAQNHLVSAVKAAATAHQVTPQALRTFDALNYGIKSFQTIFRLPFHIFNLAGGIFQSSIAGVSPKNIVTSYWRTLKLLLGNQEFSKRGGQLIDMMDVNSDLTSLGIVNIASGRKAGIQTAARAYGSGSIAKFLEQHADELGLNQMEHFVLHHADGRETDLIEFMQLAGEMQLYGTFASSLTRGSRTVNDSLIRIKMAALAPDFGGRLGKAVKIPKAIYRGIQNVAETTEVLNRTATALGLVQEGHSMRTAIEIAKEAHVPYEKLTPFERGFIKRVSAYYTFPRHYMPWAWTRFAEDPKRLAAAQKFIRDQNVVTSQEGSPKLAVGQYRIDLGRINPNIEAAGMIAAFADRIMLPGMEMAWSDVEYDRRFLRNAYSHAGLTSAGGLASLAMDDLVSQGQRSSYGQPDLFRDAGNLIWPFKAMRWMLGREGGAEDASVFTEYSPLEAVVTNGVFGLGLQKVRRQNELVQAQNRMRSLIRGLEMKAAAATKPALRQRYIDSIRELSDGYRQLVSESQQKDYR